MPDQLSAAREFFQELYGEVEPAPSRALVLWSGRGVPAARFAAASDEDSFALSCARAAAEAVRVSGLGRSVYFGVCLQDPEAVAAEARRRAREDHGVEDEAGQARSASLARGYAATASVVPGAWLDVDCGSEGHEQTGLPPDLAAARRGLEALPLPPTLLVATGGGYHAYWLWREPWYLDAPGERERAAALVRGWAGHAREVFRARFGWALDATHDLARVLRPPGTANPKHGGRVVEVVERHARVDPSELAEWAAPARPATPEHRSTVTRIDRAAEPPAAKLMAMCNLHARFKVTWERRRPDLPSQSEHDLALASMAAHAGWADSEILALVVSHRRAGGGGDKRDDYYLHPTTGLLARVRAVRREAEIEEERAAVYAAVRAAVAAPRAPEPAPAMDPPKGEAPAARPPDGPGGTPASEPAHPSGPDRDALLRDVSALLGIDLLGVVRIVADPPEYRLLLRQGSLRLGSVDSILAPHLFRAAVAAASSTVIPIFNAQRWAPVAQALLHAAEDQDLGSDSSPAALVAEWFSAYFASHRPMTDRAAALAAQLPFVADGRVHVQLSELRGWLSFHRDERISRKALGAMLRAAGGAPRSFSVPRPDGRPPSTVQVWEVPEAIAAHTIAAQRAPS